MDTLELLKKARSGDRVARNQLVEQNVGLVWNIVKRFHGRGYEAVSYTHLTLPTKLKV